MKKKLLISVAIVSSLAVANPAFADCEMNRSGRLIVCTEVASENKEVADVASDIADVATAAVSGGVVAGAVTAGGLGAANLINKTLYSNCKDQKACDAAQTGTRVGANVAAAGTLVAVGAGPAGLAAIGGAVGGGMAAGAVAVVAAPVVAAAAVGGLVYWMFSD